MFFSLAVVPLAGFNRPLRQPVLTSASTTRAGQQLDILIVHGKLVDGSGKKPRTSDVGIRGDRIVFVGDARKAHIEAARMIDATGLIIAPGFIDPLSK